jgi:hypothetical protein
MKSVLDLGGQSLSMAPSALAPDVAVRVTAVASDPIWLLRHRSHLELDEYWQGDGNAQTVALPFDGVACTIDPGEDDV